MNDGIVLVDKPRGVSSSRAASIVKRVYGANKAGHGGALDPLADGLLVVMLGQATSFARFALGAQKSYLAKVQFGAQTETDDSEGKVVFQCAPPPGLRERAQALLPEFCGEIMQTAPQYSALKHNGSPLYKLARKGEHAPNKTRNIRVDEITVAEPQTNNGGGGEENVLYFNIRAHSGFYVRAFARDIGTMLKCGAHLSALTRTSSGAFLLSNATPLDELKNADAETLARRLLPIAQALPALPKTELPPRDIIKMGGGKQLPANNNNGDMITSVYTPAGRFAGVAMSEGGALKPLRFLHWTRTETNNA